MNRLIEFDEEFKKLFLLEFTRELIKHSTGAEVFKLKQILEEEKPEKKLNEFIKQKIRIPKKIPPKKFSEEPPVPAPPYPKEEFEEKFEKSIKKSGLKEKISRKIPLPRKKIQKRPPILRIPETVFPQRLQYLRPTFTEKQIDLDKLNPLIADPMIKIIECNGPDKQIVVRGRMGVKRTNVILSKEEIKQIIKKFSESAKIPMHEGVFKVAFGQLVLSAIVSEIVGAKFIIKKIAPVPEPSV